MLAFLISFSLFAMSSQEAIGNKTSYSDEGQTYAVDWKGISDYRISMCTTVLTAPHVSAGLDGRSDVVHGCGLLHSQFIVLRCLLCTEHCFPQTCMDRMPMSSLLCLHHCSVYTDSWQSNAKGLVLTQNFMVDIRNHAHFGDIRRAAVGGPAARVYLYAAGH